MPTRSVVCLFFDFTCSGHKRRRLRCISTTKYPIQTPHRKWPYFLERTLSRRRKFTKLVFRSDAKRNWLRKFLSSMNWYPPSWSMKWWISGLLEQGILRPLNFPWIRSKFGKPTYRDRTEQRLWQASCRNSLGYPEKWFLQRFSQDTLSIENTSLLDIE